MQDQTSCKLEGTVTLLNQINRFERTFIEIPFVSEYNGNTNIDKTNKKLLNLYIAYTVDKNILSLVSSNIEEER